MLKHFRAKNRNNPEDVVEFDLGDLFAFEQNNKLGICIDYQIHTFGMADLHEDYLIEYFNGTEYVPYEEMK